MVAYINRPSNFIPLLQEANQVLYGNTAFKTLLGNPRNFKAAIANI